MTAVVVCVGVFAVSLLISWRLGQFLKACDRELDAADTFDDIIANSYTSDPDTWPRAIRFPK